jgi:hypothetical protein
MEYLRDDTGFLTLLSHLLFSEARNGEERIARAVAQYTPQELDRLWSLATSHHVIMRTFPALQRALCAHANGHSRWVESALATERKRIQNALSFLSPICHALEEAGEVIVIKSLDHWPDFGNDLDLYIAAESADVVAIMSARFGARLAERSWGDRLANKWNFVVPGLPELVEVHVNRLGQTGEQVAFTESMVGRAHEAEFENHTFRVPAAEDRVIISTLQRMYRHFYLRLCDVADIAALVDSGAIDYVYLESMGRSEGLWDGLATYLVILGEYVESYRRKGLPLPPAVTNAARFGSDRIRFDKFLRIPIFPQAATLYTHEWKSLLLHGELQNALRLSLLPGLAVAAVLALKITGTDKGIW